MASEKKNLTAAICRDTKPPATGRAYVYDLKLPGLVLCITSKGTRSFFLYRRVMGKPTRIMLGHFPATSLEDARDAAALRGAEIVRGIDPNEKKREARRDLTLGDAFQRFHERTKERGAASTAVTHKSRFDTCLKCWEGRKLSSIDREDVIDLHSALGKERGKTTANRAVQLLRAVYNHATDKLRLAVINPAARIELFKEESRERYLTADELPRFFQAVADEPEEIFRDFFMLCLWTGARRGNVQSMKWEHVNLIETVWTIPADEFKTDKIMRVVLCPEAMEILKRRRKYAEGEYVFPGHGKTGHLIEPKTAWERLRVRGGFQNLRMHDLRRTLGSWQAGLGTSLHIIGKSLGHKRPETTQIYAHMDLTAVRLAVESATAAMTAAAKKTEGGAK